MGDTKTLLPCPFCGGEKCTLHPPHFTGLGAWVACPDCGLDTPTETGVTEADAVRYWNRRASHEARIAELEGALRPFADCAEQMDRELPWARDGRITFVHPATGDDTEFKEWPVPDDHAVLDAWRYHDPQPASERMGLTMRHLRAARRALHTEGE